MEFTDEWFNGFTAGQRERIELKALEAQNVQVGDTIIATRFPETSVVIMSEGKMAALSGKALKVDFLHAHGIVMAGGYFWPAFFCPVVRNGIQIHDPEKVIRELLRGGPTGVPGASGVVESKPEIEPPFYQKLEESRKERERKLAEEEKQRAGKIKEGERDTRYDAHTSSDWNTRHKDEFCPHIAMNRALYEIDNIAADILRLNESVGRTIVNPANLKAVRADILRWVRREEFRLNKIEQQNDSPESEVPF